jgi:hypothetical protein
MRRIGRIGHRPTEGRRSPIWGHHRRPALSAFGGIT